MRKVREMEKEIGNITLWCVEKRGDNWVAVSARWNEHVAFNEGSLALRIETRKRLELDTSEEEEALKQLKEAKMNDNI